MSKHVLLFEDFKPNDTDSVNSWDIPTSKNCSIKTITLYDKDGGETIYNQDEHKGILVGDAYYDNNDNNGYQYDLKRQWIDTSLGNMIVNVLDKNYKYLRPVHSIKVELLPEGGKKTFTLVYEFDGREYMLLQRRFLPLD